jgi:hypothetical protein
MKSISHYLNINTQGYSPQQTIVSLWYPGPNTLPSQQRTNALPSAQHNKMKYATVQDVIASFPHHVLPTVQCEPDYQTIHAIRKSLQANSSSIDTHLGGGTLGHLGLIISDASYVMIAPATYSGPTLWISPTAPGRGPTNTDGTASQTSAARHIWEEDVQTCRTNTSVQQALKKQIISVFEPMYLDVSNDNIVGFANISAKDIMDHLFGTCGNITVVDLEINFEHMRRAWDALCTLLQLSKS